MIIIGVFWFIAPSSLYLNLNTNNHTFKIDVPICAFSGTYVDTDHGYTIRPSLGLPLSIIHIIPGLPIQKMDKSHINLIVIPFVNAQFDKNINHPNTQKGVIKFVLEREWNIGNFSL